MPPAGSRPRPAARGSSPPRSAARPACQGAARTIRRYPGRRGGLGAAPGPLVRRRRGRHGRGGARGQRGRGRGPGPAPGRAAGGRSPRVRHAASPEWPASEHLPGVRQTVRVSPDGPARPRAHPAPAVDPPGGRVPARGPARAPEHQRRDARRPTSRSPAVCSSCSQPPPMPRWARSGGSTRSSTASSTSWSIAALVLAPIVSGSTEILAWALCLLAAAAVALAQPAHAVDPSGRGRPAAPGPRLRPRRWLRPRPTAPTAGGRRLAAASLGDIGPRPGQDGRPHHAGRLPGRGPDLRPGEGPSSPRRRRSRRRRVACSRSARVAER